MLKQFKSPLSFSWPEIILFIALIGIVAATIYPTYQRKNAEAGAASVLLNVHRIALYYHATLAKSQHQQNRLDLKAYASPSFGQAPPIFESLKSRYADVRGISLSSRLVNHAGYFKHTTEEMFPVLFLRADNIQGTNILAALDSLTDFEHTFVSPNVMLIALGIFHKSNQSKDPAAKSSNKNGDYLGKHVTWPPAGQTL